MYVSAYERIERGSKALKGQNPSAWMDNQALIQDHSLFEEMVQEDKMHHDSSLSQSLKLS